MSIIETLKKGLKIKSEREESHTNDVDENSVVQAVNCPAYVIKHRRAYVPDRVTFKKR
ncbi:MAG: hypothetical protein K5659_04305 [Lachnospiraceae bacterium]|nr:hypothetical protein [Lachnospiraceae bacterium]